MTFSARRGESAASWIQVPFFIISEAGALPAWLAGIRRRQPGVRTLKTCHASPTVNTSSLPKECVYLSAGWPNWEGGRSALFCGVFTLSPVPETPCLRLR